MEVRVWLLWSPIAIAGPVAAPAVTLRGQANRSWLAATPPSGMVFSEEGPFRLQVTSESGGWTLEGLGADLLVPRVVPATVGPVHGTFEVGLCTTDGKTCRPTVWSLEADAFARGLAQVKVTEAPTDVEPKPAARTERPFGPAASAAALDAALARAKASGKPVLVDFSAAWCPPCNQLAAELLEAPTPDPALDAYEVAVLDADHPSSFPAKDRYDVGGYPTVLVLDADGTERTRMVGYPGLAATRDWLAQAGTSSDARDLLAGPAAASGARAAALAWWLVSAGRDEEAGPWLARAAAEKDDSAERHLAALALDGKPAELQWILDHAPARALDALGPANGLAASDPKRVAALCDLADGLAVGTVQADVLELRASTVAEGPERTALLRGAAAAVIAARTGDPKRDKPFVTWLAQLLEKSGQAEDAVALLREAAVTWPDEPTYDLALAPLLVRLGRASEALAVAERAVAGAWGDNHLRAVAARARVLAALGRKDEAKAAAAAELAAQPAPAPGTNPRTDRYRDTLKKLAETGEG